MSPDNIVVHYRNGKTINVAMFMFLESISLIKLFINITSTHVALLKLLKNIFLNNYHKKLSSYLLMYISNLLNL